MADIVLVSERVRLAMVFHRIGLVPDQAPGTRWPRAVGLQACEGADLSAREVGRGRKHCRWGWRWKCWHRTCCCRVRWPLRAASAVASATAMSLSKRALQASLQSELGAMLDMEAAGQAIASGSDYAAESVRRFGRQGTGAVRLAAQDQGLTMIDYEKTRAWQSADVHHAYTTRDSILYAWGWHRCRPAGPESSCVSPTRRTWWRCRPWPRCWHRRFLDA